MEVSSSLESPKQNVRKMLTVLSESKVIKLSVPTISAVGKPDIGDIAVVQTYHMDYLQALTPKYAHNT